MQNDDAEADAEAVRLAARLLSEAADRLASAGVRDEALGVYEEPKARFGIRRDPLIRPLGRVWRLGALLLDREGRIWATGSITRVTDPGRSQFISQSMELRRAYRAAAERGRFEDGDTVNHGAVPVPVDATMIDGAGVVLVQHGVPLVRWSPTADTLVPLEDYLRDRVDLLVHPPEGAGD